VLLRSFLYNPTFVHLLPTWGYNILFVVTFPLSIIFCGWCLWQGSYRPEFILSFSINILIYSVHVPFLFGSM
jgi:hypothetical protein